MLDATFLKRFPKVCCGRACADVLISSTASERAPSSYVAITISSCVTWGWMLRSLSDWRRFRLDEVTVKLKVLRR